MVDPDEHEDHECGGAEQGTAIGVRRDQVIERPHLKREEREAEETHQRHLEDLQVLEEGDGVDPAAPRDGVEGLPQHPGEETRGHEPCDPPPAAVGHIRKQRVRGIAPVQERLGDEPDCAPGQRVEIAWEGQYSREQSPADPAGDLQVLRLEGEVAEPEVAPHAQSVQQALGEQHGGDHRRERYRDAEPALEPARREEDVVPIPQPKVDRLEQEPDHRGPPQHQRQPAGAGEQ